MMSQLSAPTPISAPETGVPVAPTSTFSGPPIGISVQQMTTATTALTESWADARLIEIRGHRGVEHTYPDGSASLVWDEEFGVQVTVNGSAGLAELRKVAESLELVDAGDPRLAGLER
jgi:hypothetical protein